MNFILAFNPTFSRFWIGPLILPWPIRKNINPCRPCTFRRSLQVTSNSSSYRITHVNRVTICISTFMSYFQQVVYGDYNSSRISFVDQWLFSRLNADEVQVFKSVFQSVKVVLSWNCIGFATVLKVNTIFIPCKLLSLLVESTTKYCHVLRPIFESSLCACKRFLLFFCLPSSSDALN